MKIITIPQSLGENEFELILRECQPKNIQSERTIKFDFSSTSFVSSFAMVLFVLLCEELIGNQHKRILFHFSRSGRECACMFVLARLGFFDCLPVTMSFYPYRPKSKGKRGSNEAILEVTEVTDKEDAIAKIDLIDGAMTRNTQYSRGQVLDICAMASEILQNIFLHSQSKRHGLISIQGYPHLRQVQLVIADAGIGIPETIRGATEFSSKALTDAEAILESVKKGVSRFGKGADRGEGLSRCIELSAKHKARIYLRSNGGLASFAFQQNKHSSSEGAFLNGTQIFVSFPTIDFSS